MYLQKLRILGYRNFDTKFEIEFMDGLNVLVGENGVGKSAIIDAIRMMLLEDEFGRAGISEGDFHMPFEEQAQPAQMIQIETIFGALTQKEKIAFLPWTQLGNEAKLSLQIENKEINNQGKYRRTIWGGASKNSIFEWELLYTIQCTYLPPLRDAEAKLREGKGSRLARLLKNLNKKDLDEARENQTLHPLEEEVKKFNSTLSKDDNATSYANELIRSSLKSAIGSFFGQDTVIQFSEMNFNSIVESLRLLFFPQVDASDKRSLFRELGQNSLGYNNLLYLATILAEFTNDVDNDTENVKILLIEEPEAHLHPQLQIRLLKYLEEQAKKSNIQVIVTTHSPVLSAAVSVDSIIHISKPVGVPTAVRVMDCGLTDESKSFLLRWLDITKSTLFYSKGIVLVEGIAEAMVVPELAQIVLKEYNLGHEAKLPTKLEEAGISVINMNGIYFRHFIQLFCDLGGDNDTSKNIPILCSGITDNDPPKEEKPNKDNPVKGQNHALLLMGQTNKSKYCRLFSNLKTFEYDLAMEGGNLNVLIDIYLGLLKTDGTIRKEWETYKNVIWKDEDDHHKRDVAYDLLNRVEDCKGEFAQNLANSLNKGVDFQVPQYIKNAVIWACGGEI
jgi:putative ATP-dependent endonuclease of the OLD family